MATPQLDRIVKGALPPNVSPHQAAQSVRRSSSVSSIASSVATQSQATALPSIHDPLPSLPSSPECIYQNLLILEASLRAQYLSLRARLRLYLVLMAALALWLATFTYLLFLRPREDGKGAGGSPYWVVDMAEKLGWVGGVVTACLVWGTGMWDRGVRWPRRWVGVTNRGLRGFNLKLVVIRRSWWRELVSYLLFQDLLSGKVRGMNFQLIPKDIEKTHASKDKDHHARLWDRGRRETWIEEDIAPGGDTVKLLLLPKPFSPDFREDWDTHRTAYWEKENDRRAQLRAIVKERNRQVAKQQGGLMWWTGWRGWKALRRPMPADLEKPPPPMNVGSLRKDKRRGSLLRESSHSRPGSRSSTPESRKKTTTTRKGTFSLPSTTEQT